jgi:alpha-L-arabinofuranosidase
MGNACVRSVVEGDALDVKRGDGSTHRLPLLSASASLDAANKRAVVSLVNRCLDSKLDCRLRLDGGAAAQGRARRLWTEAASAHNSAAQPDAVTVAQLECAAKAGEWTETLPPHSVTVLEVGLA